jgi:uncharacterized membrane protein affecting hemolysin expression
MAGTAPDAEEPAVSAPTESARAAAELDEPAPQPGSVPASASVAVVGGARRRRTSASASDPAADGAGGPTQDAAAITVEPAQGSEPGREADRRERDGEGDTAETPTRHQRRTVSLRTAVVLGAVAVVALVAAVAFGVAWAGLNGQQAAANQVRAVSRAFVLDLTNLTPQTVDTRVSDLLDASTGTFASQAKAFFDGGNPPVRQALVAAKAVEEGQIRSLDVEAVNGSTASVFAVVDVNYTSAAITHVQSDVLRLSIDLEDTARGWKVSDVTVLTGGTGGVLTPPGG